MQCKIDTLPILGLDVDLIMADEVYDDEGVEKEGVNSLALCRIELSNQFPASYLRMVLFHEVKEFMNRVIMANSDDSHDYFQHYANIEFGVLLANRDILFGNRLVELLKARHNE